MRLRLARRELDLSGPPRIMGIVNVTPDSFYDGGVSATPEAAIERGCGMLDSGADLLDIGGMTAQPGLELRVDEEIARAVPVVQGIRARSETVISVDTYRAEVAAAALDAGADMINDHTGLSDPGLAAVVAARGAGLVVTHLAIAPKQEQGGRYQIAPAAIRSALAERVARAEEAGVAADAIVVDPGLGFGKATGTDLATLRELPALLDLGRPVLLACSHKEVTAEPLGLPESSMEGTAAVVAVAAYLGVHLLRLHDLPFMARVARMGSLLAAPRPGYAAGGARSGATSGRNLPPA